MRIAVSAIAWDRDEDDAVAALLRAHGVDAVDLVPAKSFADPASATVADARAERAAWADRGLGITGMQALLFGTNGLQLFGEPASRDALRRHLQALCALAGGLGEGVRLVFGSPRNRDRGTLSDAQVDAIATPFFRAIGDVARDHGAVFCLEPNPTHYGANYLTTCAETAAAVARIDHPAVRMQLDTGALTLNGEDPQAVLAAWGALVGHVHASEPDLLPAGDGGTDHAAMARAVRAWLPAQVVALEMVATKGEPHLASIERALGVVLRHYGGAVAGEGAAGA